MTQYQNWLSPRKRSIWQRIGSVLTDAISFLAIVAISCVPLLLALAYVGFIVFVCYAIVHFILKVW